jgi:hypothetical protein
VQARIAPWQRGARWLGEGWWLFRVAPLGWLGLVFTYWLLMTVISLVPKIGVVAASVLVPPFSVGFMAASRAAARGARPELGLLFDGFRHHLPAQLVVGGAYFACLVLLLAGTALADGGALARWMLTGARPAEETLHSSGFFYALVAAVALYLPVMMMLWFAPLLVAWHGVAPAKALFFSFFATALNWRAFIAYGVVVALVTLVAPFVAFSIVLLVAGDAAPRASVMSLIFALLIVILPTLFASFYVSYRDIFGAPEPREPLAKA